MNIEHIKEFRDFFEKEPEENYNQRAWVHPCGSPACIGGHLLYYLFQKRHTPSYLEKLWLNERGDCTITLGSHFFGISHNEANRLFWLSPFGSDNPPIKTEAVEVLDVLIETGEANWKLARKRVREKKAWVIKNRVFFKELEHNKAPITP